MARLIALYSDKPQSGKTAIANHLTVTHGFESVKFAGPLKSMVYDLLRTFKDDPDWAYRCIEGDLKEVPLPWLGGRTPRQLLITLGTDWGRNMVDTNIWVTAAYVTIKRHLVAGTSVVVDDLRFPNEYKVLEQLDASFVKVNRLNHHPAVDLTTEGLLSHLDWDLQLWAEGGDVQTLLDGLDDHFFHP